MSTDRTCNSSFWTREKDKVFENTLAIYFKDKNLLRKMEEALPGKSHIQIKDHYNILFEDIDAIDSGCVSLNKYPKMQSNANQTSKADAEWRKGTLWIEEEHRSFLQGLEIYGNGDWRSASMHCVITRTTTQVASHSQKYFKHLKANNKGNRKSRPKASILDIISVYAEAAGTFQVLNIVDMIGPACVGSQVVSNTRNESMLPRESTNAEYMTTFVNVESSSGTYSHPISELEALLSHPMDEDNDISSIFDVGKAPTSDTGIAPTAHTGMSGYAAAWEALAQLPPFATSSFGVGVWRNLNTCR